MERSRFLAGLIGPVLLAVGLSTLVNRDLGLARILAPRQIAVIAPRLAVHDPLLMAVAAVVLLLGAFLTYQAFLRRS